MDEIKKNPMQYLPLVCSLFKQLGVLRISNQEYTRVCSPGDPTSDTDQNITYSELERSANILTIDKYFCLACWTHFGLVGDNNLGCQCYVYGPRAITRCNWVQGGHSGSQEQCSPP